MAVLTAKQIAGVAVNAGFTGTALTTAVAVALAESGGNPNAHNGNANTGDDSYGLWQINMIGSMGPARRKQFDISENTQLYNPNTNASAAYAIYKQSGNSFTPWSVYKSGAYVKKLPAASKGIQENGGAATAIGTTDPSTSDGTTVSIGGLDVKIPDIGGAITQAANAFGQNVFKMGMNIGGIVVAAILLILGIVILMRAPITNVAKTVAGVASPTGKVGQAAKAVKKVSGAV